MSTAEDNNDVDIPPDLCANCGKGEDSSNNLKACTACKLVKYCNRECQIAHRPQHKKECRRRAAELHDELLFKQPPQSLGDCPICFLRMPLLASGSQYYSCCGKEICSGCCHAPVYDDQGNLVDNDKQNQCPFCRAPAPEWDNEIIFKRLKKRVEAGDALAIFIRGGGYFMGNGYQQDSAKALELWNNAGKFGYAKAYFNIGNIYELGRGGIEVDKKKAVHYYKLAAMRGDADARHHLGNIEGLAGNYDRALRHFIIAVKDGCNGSLGTIKRMYEDGLATTKDDYTQALRFYQTYLAEIRSDQRDEAVAYSDEYKYME